MCEAQCDYPLQPNKGRENCGQKVSNTCQYCEKNFCIDCMYLLCDQCHIEISCFWCGFPRKSQKNYCSKCQLNHVSDQFHIK